MPAPAAIAPQQPAKLPIGPIIIVEPRRVLDLPGRFGAGWTVVGEDIHGDVVLNRPDGNGVRSLTISKETYGKIKALRVNRARPKPPKRFFRLQQELLLPNSALRVKADDVAGGKTLVSGTVNGKFIQRWVDASLVNRAIFNPADAAGPVFTALGAVIETVQEEEKKTNVTEKKVTLSEERAVEPANALEQQDKKEEPPAQQPVAPPVEEKGEAEEEEEEEEEDTAARATRFHALGRSEKHALQQSGGIVTEEIKNLRAEMLEMAKVQRDALAAEATDDDLEQETIRGWEATISDLGRGNGYEEIQRKSREAWALYDAKVQEASTVKAEDKEKEFPRVGKDVSIVRQRIKRLGGKDTTKETPSAEEAKEPSIEILTQSRGKEAEAAIAEIKITSAERPTPSVEIAEALELYRQRQQEKKPHAIVPFLQKEIEELEGEIGKRRHALQQKARTVGMELGPDEDFLSMEFERAGLDAQKHQLTQRVKELERKTRAGLRPADESVSDEAAAVEQAQKTAGKTELGVARNELDQFNKTHGERMEKLSLVAGDGMMLHHQNERLSHLKKRVARLSPKAVPAPVPSGMEKPRLIPAALTQFETLLIEPPLTPPRQIPVGVPSLPSSSTAKPQQAGVAASGWKRQRLIALGVSPEAVTAVELGGQRQTDRMEDARTRALGVEGGIGEVAPPPSYAKRPSEGAEGEDVTQSDLSDRARAETTQKQMLSAKQAFTGESSPELVPPAAEMPETVSAPMPEEAALPPEQELLRMRAREMQSRRVEMQRDQARLKARQETTGGSSAAQAQAMKNAWRTVKGGTGASVIGLIITLAIMNIQLANKLTFKAKWIPPTDFPVEDGIVVGADCLTCIGCMASIMITIVIVTIVVKILKFVVEHPTITQAAMMLNDLFN